MEMLETIFPKERPDCSKERFGVIGRDEFPSNDTDGCVGNDSMNEISGALLDTHHRLAIPYLAIVSAAFFIGTVGNALILLVSWSARGINRAGKEFVVNLALADMCVSAVANPFCVIGVIKGKQFFDRFPFMCEFVASMCLTACFCAFLNLTLLSVNRYILVCQDSLYDRLFGRKTCVAVCMMTWPIAFLFEMPNIIGWGGHGFDPQSHSCIWDRTKSLPYTLFVALAMITAPLVLMAVCYVLVFRHIWISKKTVHMISSHNDTHAMKKAISETMRTSRTLFVLFCVFVVCWMPYAVVITVDIDNDFPMWLHLYVTLLAHLHSSANCIIYVVCSQKFRQTILKVTFLESRVAVSYLPKTIPRTATNHSQELTVDAVAKPPVP